MRDILFKVEEIISSLLRFQTGCSYRIVKSCGHPMICAYVTKYEVISGQVSVLRVMVIGNHQLIAINLQVFSNCSVKSHVIAKVITISDYFMISALLHQWRDF